MRRTAILIKKAHPNKRMDFQYFIKSPQPIKIKKRNTILLVIDCGIPQI